MFKFIVLAVIILAVFYYMDIVAKIVQDERHGRVRYKGLKLYFPFAYWLFPYKEKKKRKPKAKVKPQKPNSNEKKH